MKRRITAVILLVLLIIGGYHLMIQVTQRDVFTVKSALDDIPGDRSVSTVYTLSSEKWTVFPVPSETERIKFVSNVELKGVSEEELEHPWSYALEYRIYDSSGNELLRSDYYHRSSVSRYVTLNGKVFVAHALAGTGAPLTSPRVLRINLESCPGAHRIAIRSAHRDTAVNRVLVRLYARRAISGYRLDMIWSRMTVAERQFLARGQVYPPDLLSQYERHNLMRHSWKAQGPVGSEGDGYEKETMAVWQNHDGRPLQSGESLSGLRVGLGKVGTLPLPETGGHLRFVFQSADPSDLNDNSPVVIRWFGRSIDERFVWTNEVYDGWEHEIELAGGIIEFEADAEWSVSSFITRENLPEQEVESENNYLRVYSIDPETPVSYSIINAGEGATPFRMSLRYAWSEQPTQEVGDSIQLTYSMTDENGDEIRAGDLSFTPVVSRYDRLLPNQMEGSISDGTDFFFSVPAECAEITIRSESPVLVCGFNRPPSLPKLTSVPEDYYYYDSVRGRQPSWFSVRPRDYVELRKRGASSLILLQRRPPENIEHILQGTYELVSYEPDGMSFANYVLIPQPAEAPLRKEGLLTHYYRIPKGQNVPVEFASPSGAMKVQPRLLYVNSLKPLANITLWVDGSIHYSEKVADIRGELVLPPVDAGVRTVRLEASGEADVYMNYVMPNGEGRLAKKLAYRFESPQLSFIYERSARTNEVLNATIYSAATTNRIQLFAEIEAGPDKESGPFDSWTIQQRAFDVRPANVPECPLLNSEQTYIYGGQRCFIGVGSDLAPGRHRIRFLCDSPVDTYITLGRIQPERRSRIFGTYLPPERRSLEDVLSRAVSGGRFRKSDPRDVKKAGRLFFNLLDRKPGVAEDKGFNAIGLIVEREVDRQFSVVREQDEQRYGRGLYCVRSTEASPILLQAPHGQKDLKTREVVRILMEEGRFAAAAWNSVPRWEGEGKLRVSFDLADLEDHIYSEFTRSFGRAFPDGYVVQIHGFAVEQRKTQSARDAAAIISSGAKKQTKAVKQLAAALEAAGISPILIYPRDTRELGGTMNAQGKALRRMRHNGFIHMELSPKLREALINDKTTRKAFIQCLMTLDKK